MKQAVFAIDLQSRPPIVLEYTDKLLREDLVEFEADSPDDLDDFDWRIFYSEADAEAWLARYRDALKNLSRITESVNRELPAMLMSRRYLAQVVLDEKTSTFRSYNKPKRKPGMLFNLYDQTNFVTVRLTAIEEYEDGDFEYSFVRISK